MDIRDENKAIVIRFLEALTQGDIAKAAEAFAENATFWVPGSLPFSGTLHGRKEIVEKNLLPSIELGIPGTTRVEFGTMVAEGEYVAAEWTFKRKTARGRDYANQFFGLFRIRDGEIQSFREYLDTLYAKEMLWSDP